MKDRINLIPETEAVAPPHRQRPKRHRRWIMGGVFVLLILGVLLTTNVVLPGVRLTNSLGGGILAQLKHLTLSGSRDLQGAENDRINIILFGIGGFGHDGPLLTDTIIIASFEPSTGKAALTSLPRDLSVPYPDGSWRKINEAYTEGEKQQPGEGGKYAAKLIGSVLGQPIPYYALIDFNGFEEVIDEIGGVDVYVERPFTDPTFPTEDDLVKTVTFSAGWQHMDGEDALVFARSRHGNNGEGSDFARARRQQKIILATKDKILTGGVLLNPVAVNRLAANFGQHVKTNLEAWEIWRLYGMVKDVNPEHVIRLTPDDAPDGILKSGTSPIGAFILIPKSGSYDDLVRLVGNVFGNNSLIQEPPRIDIQNGTTVSGYAARVSDELQKRGYRVLSTKNASEKNTQQTIIYDFTNGAKPASLAALKLLFTNPKITPVLPAWFLPSAESLDPHVNDFQTAPAPQSNADFLILLGLDNAATFTTTENP